MVLEVEQKFAVPDLPQLEARLAAAGIEFAPPIEQEDHYFNHPARDFARTDESLRIRRLGEENRITYKGAKQSRLTKTRREIEFPIAPGGEAPARFDALLRALDFRPVAVVRKQRRIARCTWQDQSLEISLDAVEHLGNFAELEISVEGDDFQVAEQALLDFAERIGLEGVERRSYLEMLLARS